MSDDGALPVAPYRLSVPRVVLAVTVLALLVRLVLLGDRVAHFDEARVAWWTMEYMRTGSFEYRYIIHGPFVQHVNTVAFALLGTTDFAARLVVAVIGGLLPLSALLFRERLGGVEVVALALFLAFNPVLLYYSRFFRSTVLVAGFAFVAFGLLVRWVDTRDAWYAHLAVVFVALGFTAKENMVVYLLCWLGAGGLVADTALFRRGDGRTGLDRLRAYRPESLDDLLDRHSPAHVAGHLALALLLFGFVILLFYAPRVGSGDGVGLYAALSNPAQLPTVVEATVDAIRGGFEYWFGHPSDPKCHKDNVIDGYLCFLDRAVTVLRNYALPLMGFAVFGFLAERYAAERPRSLVMFASYWGFVSVLGYPLGTDIFGGWIMVNALVPLAIPAAVGLGTVVRWGGDALASDDRVGVALVLVVLVSVAGMTAVTGVSSSYLHPTADDNELVQYAQPNQEMRPALEDMTRAAHADTTGPDVLVYGSYFVDGDSEAVRTPACIEWFDSLPLAWYLEKEEFAVVCETPETVETAAGNETRVPQSVGAEGTPPVVIARAEHREALGQRLGDGYRVHEFDMRTPGIETVMFVREN
ncbi:TIGR03663 family protein [Halorarum halophilum]|uniref:TIGR03663 family protein n=1 Tax=Halorarum halophilum TaxID=2743090 RepID=A0A7D5KF37_9EURY|nr:flippase activity-associated protein Agl23 [Halobaculum halophilum]QLG28697.1 TIGR03663 family protein [Halobaculum halophilum]